MSMESCDSHGCQYEVVVFNAANNSVLGRISVGDSLAGLAYDSANHNPYVANRDANGTVIVISVN